MATSNDRDSLQRIRSIADYQFGKGVGRILFPNNARIVYSKRTGRIRHIFLEDKLLATLRPKDGFFSLTIEGAKRLLKKIELLRCKVKVNDEVAGFIAEGRNLFAKHVVDADNDIRPNEEVIILDSKGRLLAVGKAALTGREMKRFHTGVAVRTRKGIKET
jgi:predicted RNA-binding protein (TIGR00451 family)